MTVHSPAKGHFNFNPIFNLLIFFVPDPAEGLFFLVSHFYTGGGDMNSRGEIYFTKHDIPLQSCLFTRFGSSCFGMCLKIRSHSDKCTIHLLLFKSAYLAYIAIFEKVQLPHVSTMSFRIFLRIVVSVFLLIDLDYNGQLFSALEQFLGSFSGKFF